MRQYLTGTAQCSAVIAMLRCSCPGGFFFTSRKDFICFGIQHKNNSNLHACQSNLTPCKALCYKSQFPPTQSLKVPINNKSRIILQISVDQTRLLNHLYIGKKSTTLYQQLPSSVWRSKGATNVNAVASQPTESHGHLLGNLLSSSYLQCILATGGHSKSLRVTQLRATSTGRKHQVETAK